MPIILKIIGKEESFVFDKGELAVPFYFVSFYNQLYF